MTKKKEFPEWAKILYRGVRAGIAAGMAQAWLLQPDWTEPEVAFRTVGVAFVAGFTPAFGMWLRDQVDAWFGWQPNGLVQRFMPI